MALNKQEKTQFVRQLTDSVVTSIIHKIDSDRIPDDWDGHELRQLLADTFAYEASGLMTGARLREYRNTVLVKNL